MLQVEDTGWQTGLNKAKHRSPGYTGHKRPTLGQRTHVDAKWVQKKTFHANGSDVKAGVANTNIRQNRLYNKGHKER